MGLGRRRKKNIPGDFGYDFWANLNDEWNKLNNYN